MQSYKSWRNHLVSLLLALLLTALLGSVLQSLLNLRALTALAVDIPVSDWLTTIIYDVLHFAPVLAALVLATDLLALPLAAILQRRWPLPLQGWWWLAGIVGLALTFRLVDALAPMPTFIAATRDTAGWLLMSACGAVGAGVAGCYWQRQQES